MLSFNVMLIDFSTDFRQHYSKISISDPIQIRIDFATRYTAFCPSQYDLGEDIKVFFRDRFVITNGQINKIDGKV